MSDPYREVKVIAACKHGVIDGKELRAQIIRVRRFHKVWCPAKGALTMQPYGTFWCVLWGMIDGVPTTSLQFLSKRGALAAWRALNLPL